MAGAMPAEAAGSGAHGATAAPGTAAPDNSSLVMVLDSSGSVADDDGTGRTRTETARSAVGTVVDGLPDHYPTGLRVYGADRTRGCTDTRLFRPVQPLDRTAVKQAVAGVRPKGDTPVGLSLQKAAEDLPEPADGAMGTRTILLISDGEDNCGTPQPCEVAEQLGDDRAGLRIDTVGFQVKGRAREQLECIAEAGNGRYYDAPDAKSLARQLQRASQLSADGYRFRGERVEGAATGDRAPLLAPGQYLDAIGPGEKRYYAVDLDAVSTADFSATAVPQPGAAVDTFDALLTSIAYGAESSCATNTEHSLWYKVPAGWGQQVRYDVEFANEPTVEKASSCSYGATQLFTPARFPVGGGGEFTSTAMYDGRPAAIRMGSVPVAWTNRYEYRSTVQPVHTRGEFYISVTLGARAAEIAENPQVGVVLRVSVLRDERAGPEHGAPVVGKNADNEADKRGKSPSAADSGGGGGAGWTGIAAAAGAGAVVVVIAALVFVRSRRRSATQTTRGSA
ncbi:VWA domain-containing protein [Streptomyces sp. NPDC001981]|uniref:vWA domain-containing protein n=1 Tax=Streptomyces sp. NPDC001981 TaxID=3364628 RepID=UPI003698E6A8